MDYKEKVIALLNSQELSKEQKEMLETIFPELMESEDERIRKSLLKFCKTAATGQTSILADSVDFNKCVTWLEKQGGITKLSDEEQNKFAKGVLTSCALSFIDYLDAHKYEDKMCVSNGECEDIENAFHNAMWDRLHRYYCKYIEKQGEQKTIDKIEPKFHEGEWLCENESNNYARFIQILEIVNVQGKDRYRISRDIHSDEDIVEFDFVEKYYNKFDIQDAKAGDVLADDYGIYIFEKFDECDKNCYVCIGAYQYSQKVYECEHMLCSTDAHPATKEQRDLLFQKMHDAGYEWDAEKKELKKIEQKPDWSEEDKKMSRLIGNAITDDGASEYLESKGIQVIDAHVWLYELKDRVQPHLKQEWSEEDERLFQIIIDILDRENHLGNLSHTDLIACVKKLKSLRPQATWKPSEEQMLAINTAINVVGKGTINGKYLIELQEHLKKL